MSVSWTTNQYRSARAVISRNVFGEFWWRGRSPAANGTFVDGPVAPGASDVDYRVSWYEPNGALAGSRNCSLSYENTFECFVEPESDGSHVVTWDSQFNAGVTSDYVVSRQLVPDPPLLGNFRVDFYWRGRTDLTSFRDAPGPNYGRITYSVTSRRDGVITGRCLAASVSSTQMCAQLKHDRSECEALVALYLGTNGADWVRNDGWNSLTTPTPAEPCSYYGVTCEDGRVVGLSLGSNSLDGALPESLVALTELRTLELRSNALIGTFPAWIAEFTKLEQLLVGLTRWTGTLPPSWGRLTHLRYLHLSLTNAEGSFPAEWASMDSLQQLIAPASNLSGDMTTFASGVVDTLQVVYLQGRNHCLYVTDPEVDNRLDQLYPDGASWNLSCDLGT